MKVINSFRSCLFVMKSFISSHGTNKIRTTHVHFNTKLGHHISIGNSTFIFENVSIGNYTYINRNSYIQNCSIGNYCSISSNVFISPEEHDLSRFSTYPLFENNKGKEQTTTIIGHDVLISAGAFIKKGVQIGNGAVIGMGSVVTKNIPPYAIAVGNPARVIKYRFSEKTINELEKTKWWNNSINELDLLNLENCVKNNG